MIATLIAMPTRSKRKSQTKTETNAHKNAHKNAHDIAAPSFALLALELRAFWEFGAVLPAWPALMRAPRGDGHPVIVFPGLAASDTSTVPLRRYLEALGHQVSGWEQGSNFGPRAGVLQQAKRLVKEAFESSGRKVSLVGWSLGGVYAREIAKEMPECVRSVSQSAHPLQAGPVQPMHGAFMKPLVAAVLTVNRTITNWPRHPACPPPASIPKVMASSLGKAASKTLQRTMPTQKTSKCWPAISASA
jgi:pimeloyl-ACP methyl ester carboxylesterase